MQRGSGCSNSLPAGLPGWGLTAVDLVSRRPNLSPKKPFSASMQLIKWTACHQHRDRKPDCCVMMNALISTTCHAQGLNWGIYTRGKELRRVFGISKLRSRHFQHTFNLTCCLQVSKRTSSSLVVFQKYLAFSLSPSSVSEQPIFSFINLQWVLRQNKNIFLVIFFLVRFFIDNMVCEG